MDKQLLYKIGITLLPGIGPVLAKNLIAYLGDSESVFHQKKATLMKVPGIGEILANEIINANVLKIAEKEISFIEKAALKCLFYLDVDYPARLKNCPDAPILLFIKGAADLNPKKAISIVGTRNATPEGREITENLVKNLYENGHDVSIISGLAYGIDITAHKSSIKHNLPTIAVLGHGLNTIYPQVHRNIAKEIIEKGALVTEYLSQTKMEPSNFVKRNRIIAGMSDATIVVESGIKGGALVTADIANSYNRDVFAFPGRISDKFSQGCNKLIKINKAALIESVADLEYCLGWDKSTIHKEPVQKDLFQKLNEEESKIVNLLNQNGDLMIDIIAAEVQIPMSKVSAILLNLEFSGLIRSLPGKVYSLR